MGNTKIGDCLNLSFPPVVTCRPNAPCIHDCCAWRKNVLEAWEENLFIYNDNPFAFWDLLEVELAKCIRFRLFVGGDFPRSEMIHELIEVAGRFSTVKILVFTKRVEWLPDHSIIPDNLALHASMWPGLPPDTAPGYRKAWFLDTRRPMFPNTAIPKSAFLCPQDCKECGYKCWEGSHDVVFRLHNSQSKKYDMYYTI
jgi:hypothetical protein